MAFKNCILEENERREYTLPDGEKKTFVTGTVDGKNNIRLHCYANGSVMEPSDIFSFVFDYKGKVYFKNFMRILNDASVTWQEVSSLEDFDEQELLALREAFEKYSVYGFSYDDNIMARNEMNKVRVTF